MSKAVAWMGFGLLSCGASAAMAQVYGPPAASYQGLYMGASAGEVFYNEDGLGAMNPTVFLFRIGEQFSPFVALEGRIGTSVDGGSWDGLRVNAQAIYGAYVKGIWPTSPWFSVYGLAGLGGAQWHRNYPDSNTNDIGLSFGAGGEFNLGYGTSLDLEFSRLTNGDNAGYSYNANQLLFGVNWRF
jgi:Outer membrane protein beta-barrel domain